MKYVQLQLKPVFILIAGVMLGLFAKVLDETPSNLLPPFIEGLDLRNFFSRTGIWMFLGLLIAISSKTAARAAVNVGLFFIGMTCAYYLYTILIAGFFPRSYMIFWLIMAILSGLAGYAAWYAKRQGWSGVFISSIIVWFMSRQAFYFGFWYFDVSFVLELLLWFGTIIVLFQSPKQIIKVVAIGMSLFFLTAHVHILWGLL